MNTEKQARLEILSQNQKDFQIQVAMIKQTLEKVLDQDTSLAERIHALFKEQGITIAAILTALSMTVSTIVLAITGIFGGGVGGGRRAEGQEALHQKRPLRHCLLLWEVLLVPF